MEKGEYTLTHLKGCFDWNVETVQSSLMKCQREGFIQKYEERTPCDQVHAFGVTLETGETFDIYVSFQEEFNRNGFFKLSLNIDSLVIGNPLWANLEAVAHFVESRVAERRRWFMIQAKAYRCLEQFRSSSRNDFISTVKKGENETDFVLECTVKERKLTIGINVRSNRRWVLKNREENITIPSIYTTVKELDETPGFFIKKVTRIKRLLRERDILDHVVPPASLHIVTHMSPHW